MSTVLIAGGESTEEKSVITQQNDGLTCNTLGKDLTCLFADSNEFRINTDCDAVRSRRHGKGSVVSLRARGHCHKSSPDSNNVKWFAQKQR